MKGEGKRSKREECGLLCKALDDCAFLTRYIKGMRDRISESLGGSANDECKLLYEELGVVDCYVRRAAGRISKYLKEKSGGGLE